MWLCGSSPRRHALCLATRLIASLRDMCIRVLLSCIPCASHLRLVMRPKANGHNVTTSKPLAPPWQPVGLPNTCLTVPQKRLALARRGCHHEDRRCDLVTFELEKLRPLSLCDLCQGGLIRLLSSSASRLRLSIVDWARREKRRHIPTPPNAPLMHCGLAWGAQPQCFKHTHTENSSLAEPLTQSLNHSVVHPPTHTGIQPHRSHLGTYSLSKPANPYVCSVLLPLARSNVRTRVCAWCQRRGRAVGGGEWVAGTAPTWRILLPGATITPNFTWADQRATGAADIIVGLFRILQGSGAGTFCCLGAGGINEGVFVRPPDVPVLGWVDPPHLSGGPGSIDGVRQAPLRPWPRMPPWGI